MGKFIGKISNFDVLGVIVKPGLTITPKTSKFDILPPHAPIKLKFGKGNGYV